MAYQVIRIVDQTQISAEKSVREGNEGWGREAEATVDPRGGREVMAITFTFVSDIREEIGI
jgi:hypothetical protein